MLNVVLVEPEIPSNTGNVGRTCLLAGASLHLVGPLGFSLGDAEVRRAGLGFWKSLKVASYASWEEFLTRNQLLASPNGQLSPTVHLLTKTGGRTYAQSCYADGDWLVFGKESAGLDRRLIDANPDLCERIPMTGDAALTDAEAWRARHGELHPELARDACGNYVDPRCAQISSLNLSNAVAIVLFEALRQQGFPGLA